MPPPSDQRDFRKYFFVSLLVLLLLGAGIIALILYNNSDQSRVSLNVSSEPPFISGFVTHNGKPVPSGRLHVVLERSSNDLYEKSFYLEVQPDGSFKQGDEPQISSEDFSDKQNGYRVTANFVGQVAEQPVTGESIVHLNKSAPYLQHEETVFVATALVLLFVLLFLFTGEIGARKSRFLFGMMYFMTFQSLFVPIAITVWVAQDDNAVKLMKESPIGLVRGTAKGISEPQWLVNIGGNVVPGKSTPEVPQNPKEAEKKKENDDPPSSEATAALQTRVPAQSGNLIGEISRRPTGPKDKESSKENTSPQGSDSTEKTEPRRTGVDAPSRVEGGLAVPFYVVLLAMFGAGINMTRKIPKIQKASDAELFPSHEIGDVVKTESTSDTTRKEHLARAATIRVELVQNFMYVFSAPFLAIAVYYLLQVIASEVAQPVLVLMGFSTGLLSDVIVQRIVRFAEETLGSPQDKQAESEQATQEEKLEAMRKNLEAEREAKEAALYEGEAKRLEEQAAKNAAEAERLAEEAQHNKRQAKDLKAESATRQQKATKKEKESELSAEESERLAMEAIEAIEDEKIKLEQAEATEEPDKSGLLRDEARNRAHAAKQLMAKSKRKEEEAKQLEAAGARMAQKAEQLQYEAAEKDEKASELLGQRTLIEKESQRLRANAEVVRKEEEARQLEAEAEAVRKDSDAMREKAQAARKSSEAKQQEAKAARAEEQATEANAVVKRTTEKTKRQIAQAAAKQHAERAEKLEIQAMEKAKEAQELEEEARQAAQEAGQPSSEASDDPAPPKQNES